MLFKCSYTTLVLIFFSFASKAQLLLGFEAGISNNSLKSNNFNQVSTNINSQRGYCFAAKIQVKLCNWLFVAAVPGLIQKNYSINRTDSLAGIYADYTHEYLQVPFMFHAVIGKRLKCFFDAGVFGGYWISGKVEGKVPDIFSASSDNVQQNQYFNLVSYRVNYKFDQQKDQRIAFGYVTGAGLQYRLFRQLNGFAVYRYYYAVSNHQKSNITSNGFNYDQTATISLGVLYNLSKFK